jgi:tetratricopeptide (TPR) repeat protein
MADNAADNAIEDVSHEDLLALERSSIFETRLQRGSALREAGNRFFKTGSFADAEKAYRRALFHVEMDEMQVQFELMDHHWDALFATKIPTLLNLSQCLMRQGHEGAAAEVVTLTDEVLQMDKSNVKALFWRAKANTMLHNPEKAVADLTTALQLAPDDKAVKTSLKVVKMQLREADRKSASSWRGIFKSSSSSNNSVAASGDATAVQAQPGSAAAAAALKTLRQTLRTLLVAFVLMVAVAVAFTAVRNKYMQGKLTQQPDL